MYRVGRFGGENRYAADGRGKVDATGRRDCGSRFMQALHSLSRVVHKVIPSHAQHGLFQSSLFNLESRHLASWALPLLRFIE